MNNTALLPKTTLLLCLALLSHLSYAYPDSLTAVLAIQKTKELIRADQTDSLDFFQQKALQVFRQNDDLRNWIKTQTSILRVWRDERKEGERALECYQKAQEAMWRRPKKNNGEFKQLANLHINAAYTYRKYFNDNQTVCDHYEMARKIFVDTLNLEDMHVAKYIYSPLGNTYTRLREFGLAEYYLTKKQQISRAAGDWKEAAEALSDLGMMEINKKNFDAATQYFLKGLTLEKNIPFTTKGMLLENIGVAYLDWGKLDLALHYTQLAIAELDKQASMGEKIWPEDRMYILENLAGIYKAKNEYRLAEQTYQEFEAIIANSEQEVTPYTQALFFIGFGNFYLQWKKPAQALPTYQKAVATLIPFNHQGDVSSLPPADLLKPEPILINAFEGMAEAMAKMHENNPADQWQTFAWQYHELIQTVEDLMIDWHQFERAQLWTLGQNKARKAAAIRFAYQQWKESGGPSWKEKAFWSSERGRNQLLLNAFKTSANDLLASVPDSLISQEQQIRNEIVQLEQELYLKKDSVLFFSSLKQQLISNKEKLKTAQQKIKSYLSATNPMAEQEHFGHLSELQNTLAPSTAIIEFFIADNTTYVFTLTNKELLIEETPVSETQLNTLVDSLRYCYFLEPGSDHQQRQTLSHELYQLLLANSLKQLDPDIDQLTIIPDGTLGYLPFSLLITEAVADKSRPIPYLLNQYEINYAYSAALLHEQQQIPKERATKFYMGFASSYEGLNLDAEDEQSLALRQKIRSGLYHLEGAISEIDTIAAMMNGQQFSGKTASEYTFQREAPNCQILHLAMHTLIEDEQPLFSKLLFTPGASDTLADDQLNAVELYNMTLNADLAILSACETGYGQLQQGEGIMSLARAFTHAGVPSTLMSLWKVPDEATTPLMIYFFENLKKGQNKARALRNAKRQFITYAQNHVPEWGHPYYWAGFILSGDTEAIDFPKSFSFRFYILGAFLVLGIMFFYQIRK